MTGRKRLACGAVLAAVACAAWLRAESHPPTEARSPVEVGRWYSLHPVDRNSGREFDATSGCYELIVGSLGDAGREFRVTLEGAAIAPGTSHGDSDRIARSSRLPIDPLASHRIRSRDERRAETGAGHSMIQATAVAECAATSTAPERRFFLHVTSDPLEDPQGYVPVTGSLAGVGRSVQVYVDREMAEPASGLVAEIIRLMDDEIIPRSQELIGEHTDMDGDGKLAILVTSWLGRLCGGKTSLNGFVRANDFQAGIDPPYGNHADVLYLNSALEPGPALKTLLAHEYTHAVCFSRRFADTGRNAALPDEEDWLNEAIAHVAEDLHGSDRSNLEQRVAGFLAAPQKSPLAIRDYYRAGLWRDPGCRGATYLFLRHCADQFGPGLLNELVESSCVGSRNLEQVTGVSFAELFRNWTIALADDAIPSVPLHGQFGECRLAGLARVDWPLESEPCRLELRGTSAALVRFTVGPGTRRISIQGSRDARLQLTIIRRTAANITAQ